MRGSKLGSILVVCQLCLLLTIIFNNIQSVYCFAPKNSNNIINHHHHQQQQHHNAIHTVLHSATEEAAASTSYAAPINEIERRRNLAIISHPDSGKTTMTEKLLLYGGAIQQAGAVRQKAEQR